MRYTEDQLRVIRFLKEDMLRNIVPLKMLAAHPEVIETGYQEGTDGAAALLLFPTGAFAYDQATYADFDLVVILAATDLTAAEVLVGQIPRDHKLIFKLMDPAVQRLISEHFVLQRVTAFLSYTAVTAQGFMPDNDVVAAATIDERLLTHFAAQGHDQAEIERYFADGEGRAFTIYQQKTPVASCFTYQNFESIHEIGGVFTLPSERRKGYARKVVQSAVHSLLARGYQPRYQVHEENTPSIGVAEQLGLTRFVTVDHWRYKPVV